jgi:hypothetical protein
MPEPRVRFCWSVALMVAAAVAVRIHNVVVFPALRAPDGFGHFTYIWYLADTGRVPLAMSGWSFFHPPLYYALMAAFWRLFAPLAPVARLKLGTGLVALLGLMHAGVCYAFVRRRFPDDRVVQVAAPGFLLFLPVQLYTAGYLGNEALGAVLCSLSLLLLLHLLEHPFGTRAALLGLGLGLGMLTKFTALGIVIGAYATIAVSSFVRRDVRGGIRLLAITTAVMLAVCGWFYARNVRIYGTPFQTSRDTLEVRRIENMQTQGERGLLEYVLFDPLILAEPHWPRGLPLYGKVPADTPRGPLRESVWTGVFANAFFDAVGGQVIPPITHDQGSLRAGQVLLTLGLVPTALVLLGMVATLGSLRRSGWSHPDAAMLASFVATLLLFVYSTKAVPMHAAVKATYLSPALAMFGFWFAHGLHRLRRAAPRVAVLALASCVLLAAASATVFTLGVVVGRGYLGVTPKEALWQNLYGVVAYAGGERERARALFEASASRNWHLAHENLAAMALEDGRPVEALRHLRAASRWRRRQSFGLPEDQRLIDHATQADYRNSMAVIYYGLGRMSAATAMLRKSRALDDAIPEASYNQGVLDLTAALNGRDPEQRDRLLKGAADAFERATVLDAGFDEAWAMRAAATALSGRCDVARASLAAAETAKRRGLRLYPLETGTGDQHGSGLHRRRRIETLRVPLRDDVAQTLCASETADRG